MVTDTEVQFLRVYVKKLRLMFCITVGNNEKRFDCEMDIICYTYENNFNPRYSEFLVMFADIGRETDLTESKISVQKNKQNELQVCVHN